ncbi:site-specific integrase [Pedobacter antarcticus]|uniref:site-specific integrase n=1 Tax=Pedobacter antarcticus TaxID=34086 RepID=UPI00292F6833|nr:site-specific integrase [Pedobacter antarcticus]
MISYSVKLKANKSRIQKNGRASLYFLIIINRQSKTIPLNLSWPADLVDNNSGVFFPRHKKDKDFNDYQLIIHNELEKINEIFKVYRIQDKVLSMDLFLIELRNIDRRRNFLAFMADKIDSRFTDKSISTRTRLNNYGTLNLLTRFQSTVPFYAIDRPFLRRFATFLKTRYKNEDSTIWGRIKDIKTYLHLAVADGISVNLDFENYTNSAPSSRLVYLEEPEINKLIVLYNSKKLDELRSVALRTFLFSCFTSLRISDVFRAEWGWLKMNNELVFVPWKNRRFRREVSIPLSNIAKSLIQKRTGKFFDLPTEQEINRSLKDIASECGIIKNLTFHVARHTFGTHYYRQTKDLASLQKIMGHSKITTTMIYVHINDQDKRNGIDLMAESFLKTVPVMRLVS